MGQYLQLAKRAIAQRTDSPSLTAAPLERSTRACEAGRGDRYAERMQATLKQINRLDYSAGMLPWLREAYPQLYSELTERLPDKIHRLWTTYAPLEDFEHALADLLNTHRETCLLYKAHLATKQEK